MRRIWIAPMLSVLWSCGGQAAGQAAAADGGGDSSMGPLRDSGLGSETSVASCTTFAGFGPPTTYGTMNVSASIFLYAPRGGSPDFAVYEPFGADDGGPAPVYEFFMNSGAGVFASGTFPGSSGNNFANAIAADFHRSGLGDIASIQRSAMAAPMGTVTVDTNLGDGGYDDQLTTYTTRDPGGYLASGDFNGDGTVDLAVAGAGILGSQPCLENCSWDYSLSLYSNAGNGTFGTPSTYMSVGQMTSIATGDFNGDTHLDIALPPHALALNQGDGTFGTPFLGLPDVASTVSNVDTTAYNALQTPWVVGDFDGNGLTDIATSATTTANLGELIVFLNAGGGAFGPPTTYVASGTAQHMVGGDFDGDGRLDLAVQYHAQQATDGGAPPALPVGLFLNAGNGSFGAEMSYPMGADPVWIAAADFNGDGVDDLAVVNTGSANGVTVRLSQCR